MRSNKLRIAIFFNETFIKINEIQKVLYVCEIFKFWPIKIDVIFPCSMLMFFNTIIKILYFNFWT